MIDILLMNLEREIYERKKDKIKYTYIFVGMFILQLITLFLAIL